MQSEKLTKLENLATDLGPDTEEQLSLMRGLSDQQRFITRFKLRGLSQAAIAKILEVTPARVSQEMKVIRTHYIDRGSDINQAAVVGETVTLYEEIEQKAWEVFHNDESKKLRALGTIMEAREKQLKLLMDLGLVQRAAVKHDHSVSAMSPVMESLTPQRRQDIVARIIEPPPGIEPEPPSDEDIAEAEIIYGAPEADTDDGETEGAGVDRLPPTPEVQSS